MARYRHYDPQQTKMIAVSYGRQLLPEKSFQHARSYLIENENDLGRFAARFKNDETGAPAYVRQGAGGDCEQACTPSLGDARTRGRLRSACPRAAPDASTRPRGLAAEFRFIVSAMRLQRLRPTRREPD